jgi:hypothetical protein
VQAVSERFLRWVFEKGGMYVLGLSRSPVEVSVSNELVESLSLDRQCKLSRHCMTIAHRKLIREHRLQIRRIAGHQHDIADCILKY